MEHYGVEEWTDYVRGVVAEDLIAPMKEHLERCDKCSSKVRFLTAVTIAARADARLAPLDAAVRAVNAYYTVQQPQRTRRFKPLVLEIAFDSLLLPRPAGARGTEPSSRQLVCYAADYALTVRLDREAQDLRLGGEILSRLDGPLSDVQAFLLSRGEVLSQTTSGKLGEFDLHAAAGEALRLSVVIDEKECLEVELDPPRRSSLEGADNVIEPSRDQFPDWGPEWKASDYLDRDP